MLDLATSNNLVADDDDDQLIYTKIYLDPALRVKIVDIEGLLSGLRIIINVK